MSGQITVVGAGAIGGFVAAGLLTAGRDLVLVDANADHVDAMRRRGLRVSGASTLLVRPAVALPDELEGNLGTVLLAVKARHTQDALSVIAPRLAPDGVIVSLQNGLAAYQIASAVGSGRTVAACLTFGGHFERPGEIVHGGPGSFRIGALDAAAADHVEPLVQLLGMAHPVAASDRILDFVWAKTALEAFYFATALADADVTEVLARREHLPWLGELVAEVARVAAAEGVTCTSVDGFEPMGFLHGSQVAIRASWDAQRRYWDAHLARRTGIWRDLAVHRRPTEVDAILGPVLCFARNRRVAVPRLQRLIELVREAQEGRRRLGWSALAELGDAG